MSVEILHDYRFPTGTITELKFNHMFIDSSKHQRYQWVLTKDGMKRYDMDFIEMDGNVRVLFHREIGKVRLDLDNMTIQINGVDPVSLQKYTSKI